jgi:hypothetical protein
MPFLTLLLLADLQVCWSAPHITWFDEADDFALQTKIRQPWGR